MSTDNKLTQEWQKIKQQAKVLSTVGTSISAGTIGATVTAAVMSSNPYMLIVGLPTLAVGTLISGYGKDYSKIADKQKAKASAPTPKP
tara:strand:- start:1844 stop:2107 length:264 start_codon:yes stop_codon:yes gene_type:complete